MKVRIKSELEVKSITIGFHYPEIADISIKAEIKIPGTRPVEVNMNGQATGHPVIQDIIKMIEEMIEVQFYDKFIGEKKDE